MLSIFAYQAYQKFRPIHEYDAERIHFKVYSCREVSDILTPTQFIVREWIQDGAFHVRALETSDCGRQFSSAAFQVAGNLLTLEYRTQPWKGNSFLGPPACDCRFTHDYVIKGLPKKDWDVEIQNPDLSEDVYAIRKAGGRRFPPPPPASAK